MDGLEPHSSQVKQGYVCMFDDCVIQAISLFSKIRKAS